MHLLELKDLSKYYHTNDVITIGLRKINLGLDSGEFVAVVGESGSGKSTLMNVVSGMDTFEEGEMLYNEEETSCFTAYEWDKYRKDNISFIFQDYNLIESYTVLQNVEISLIDKFPDRKLRRERALYLIEQVELTSHIKHKCTKLSGGQKQRVAIARALAKDAPIIIADEPTGNLDEVTGKSIIKLLDKISKDKLLIMVTHNFEDVQEYATRKIRLFDGSIIEDKVLRTRQKDVNIIKANDVKVKDNIFKRIFRKNCNLLKVSLTNTFATPKKSIMLFSTVFISTILILIFVFLAVNYILYPDLYTYFGDRRDTAVVYREDRSEFDNADIEKLKNIKGVNDSMLYYYAYQQNLYSQKPVFEDGYNMNIFEILAMENFDREMVDYGRLPEKDNEIMLTYYMGIEPDLELIGTEVGFGFSIDGYNENEYYIDPNMPEEENLFVSTFTIVGFAISNNKLLAFITSEAVKQLSINYIEDYVYNLSFEARNQNGRSVFNTKYNVVFDDSIEIGEAVLVYRETDYHSRYYTYTDQMFYNIYNYILYNPEITAYITIEEPKFNDKFSLKVTTSTPIDNSDLYNLHYQGYPVLIINPLDFVFNIDYYKRVNTAFVVLDLHYNPETTLNRLKDEGYKVIYKYDRQADQNYYAIIDAFTILAIGLGLLGLSILLVSEIYFRIMRNKKKDYNILRSLGINSKDVTIISIFESLIIHLAVFVIIVIGCIIFYKMVLITHNNKIFDFIYALLPLGFFNLRTVFLFTVSFMIILSQSLYISYRFNNKMAKSSVKKVSVEK